MTTRTRTRFPKARPLAVFALLFAAAGVAVWAQQRPQPTEWKVWGGDAAQTHFSPLTQITPLNVARLKPVWVYNPGTTGRGWENTPLLIDGLLYVSDPTGDIVALDPVNGEPAWRWKSDATVSRVRGLAYWAGDGTMKPRVLATRAGRVLGFDLKTGVPVTDWPDGGFNLGFPQPDGSISPGGTNSSPPLIFKNMIVSATGGFQPGGAGRRARVRSAHRKTALAHAARARRGHAGRRQLGTRHRADRRRRLVGHPLG